MDTQDKKFCRTNISGFKRFQNPPMKTEKYAKFGINFK